MEKIATFVEDGKKKKVMSNEALEANRNNAQKSTGPKTGTRNPLALPSNYRHGILASVPVLPGVESQEEYDQHVLELKTDMRPSGAIETALVEKLANILWKKRRLQIYENSYIKYEIEKIPEQVTMFWKSWYEILYKNPEGYIDFPNSNIKQLKQELQDFEICKQAFDEFDDLPKDEIMDRTKSGYLVQTILEFVYKIKKENKEELPEDPLELFDFDEIVKDFWDKDKNVTPTQVRQILEFISEKIGYEYDQLIYYSKALLESLLSETKSELEKFEKEIEAKSFEKLFDGYISEKVMRLEAHLNRQFLQTLHELQRMQGMRIGISSPPEAIDITGYEKES